MGYKLPNFPEDRFSRDSWSIFDDFAYYVDGDLWTKAVVTTGTVAHAGDEGLTRLKLFCTAAADAAVLATTNEIFKFTANKAMVAEARIIFTDVNTDDGHVGFGWANALAAATLADTTGAVTATDALLIHKLPDTTVWRAHSEINTLTNKAGDGSSGAPAAETISDSTAGGTSYQTLRIEAIPRSSTIFDCWFYVDGVPLKTSSGVVLKHAVALGTATDMDFGIMTKSNHADDFNFYVDYLYAGMVRV